MAMEWCDECRLGRAGLVLTKVGIDSVLEVCIHSLTGSSIYGKSSPSFTSSRTLNLRIWSSERTLRHRGSFPWSDLRSRLSTSITHRGIELKKVFSVFKTVSKPSESWCAKSERKNTKKLQKRLRSAKWETTEFTTWVARHIASYRIVSVARGCRSTFDLTAKRRLCRVRQLWGSNRGPSVGGFVVAYLTTWLLGSTLVSWWRAGRIGMFL